MFLSHQYILCLLANNSTKCLCTSVRFPAPPLILSIAANTVTHGVRDYPHWSVSPTAAFLHVDTVVEVTNAYLYHTTVHQFLLQACPLQPAHQWSYLW